MATFAQYNRLGLHVCASPREVIRAARRLLAPSAFAPKYRVARHAFYRDLLAYHAEARHLYHAVTHGNIG